MSLKNNIMMIAIIILTIFVVVYGVNILYDKPERVDFCGEFKTAEIIDTPESCEEIGGNWAPYVSPRAVEGIEGYCDRDFTCRQEYDDARETYSRNIFLIALPVGIAIIALGALSFGLEFVGAGIMGGGVGCVLWGVGGFWEFADVWLTFILSLIGLVVVICLANYVNKRIEGKGKKRKRR